MRPCIFTERKYVGSVSNGTRKIESVVSQGNFVEWGVDFVEFESGGAEYSAGIIEVADGTVKLIRADDIKFTDQPPSMAKESSAPEKAVEARLTDSQQRQHESRAKKEEEI